MTIHDRFIHHIEDERIIDVLYRHHDYTVSNFNDVWGLSEQDYEIGEYHKENWITGSGIIRVKILAYLLLFSSAFLLLHCMLS